MRICEFQRLLQVFDLTSILPLVVLEIGNNCLRSSFSL